jgi:broad specificity phosphatase PhoE
MKTVLYLIRHGATAANLADPPRLQGRRQDPPLAPLGVRQAEATRDLLANLTIDRCYSSPLARAVQTAAIVAGPHGLAPVLVEDLTECDVGSWEGLDWQTVRRQDAEAYHRFMANPAQHGYRDGESFADVHARVSRCLEQLFERHAGEAILVVGHHAVNRTYLAGLLGLAPDRARQVKLDNCGVSVVVREGEGTWVGTLNATFHLHGLAA